MPPARRSQLGYIDNRPVFVIILIIAVIGAQQFLKLKGIDPAELWSQVPAVWRNLFWSTVAFVFFGAIVAAVTVIADERREPFRVEARGDRREIVETALALRVICALLVLLGLMLAAFAAAGEGWFSWVAFALGAVLVFAGGVTFGSRKRYVVERGRVVLGVVLDPRPAAGADDAAARQAVLVKSDRTGGAFGQPLVEHNRVFVDDREILDAPFLEKAEKLAAALKQAMQETAPPRSA